MHYYRPQRKSTDRGCAFGGRGGGLPLEGGSSFSGRRSVFRGRGSSYGVRGVHLWREGVFLWCEGGSTFGGGGLLSEGGGSTYRGSASREGESLLPNAQNVYIWVYVVFVKAVCETDVLYTYLSRFHIFPWGLQSQEDTDTRNHFQRVRTCRHSHRGPESNHPSLSHSYNMNRHISEV